MYLEKTHKNPEIHIRMGKTEILDEKIHLDSTKKLYFSQDVYFQITFGVRKVLLKNRHIEV